MNAIHMEAILRLSIHDRIRLVQQIWDSIDAESEPEPLSPQQVSEIDRRIAAYREDPSRAIPWEDAIARLRERHG